MALKVTQVTWLHGSECGRYGLLLEFAVGAQPLPANFSVGQVIDASMVFFDGCPQLRVLESQRFASGDRRLYLPAEAGIQPGDVVLSVDGNPVRTPGELRQYVGRHKDHVALLIARGDTRIFVPVALG